MVFTGLGIVVPLLSSELLQFPKLARAFFALLGYMMEVYPDRVAGLPGALGPPWSGKIKSQFFKVRVGDLNEEILFLASCVLPSCGWLTFLRRAQSASPCSWLLVTSRDKADGVIAPPG